MFKSVQQEIESVLLECVEGNKIVLLRENGKRSGIYFRLLWLRESRR